MREAESRKAVKKQILGILEKQEAEDGDWVGPARIDPLGVRWRVLLEEIGCTQQSLCGALMALEGSGLVKKRFSDLGGHVYYYLTHKEEV